jgi:predicted aspartyl protease
MTSAVPFEYLAHVLVIPVTVSGVETKFVFDTGIGLSLISEDLAARVGVRQDGSTFTGRRMSGQAVTVPLGSVDSLEIGATRMQDVQVGIFDMHAMAGLGEVEGFVSLSYFRTTPVTVDYPARRVIVEDAASLAERAASGTSVAVRIREDNGSTDLALSLDLPGGKAISVEIDTGSDTLILNQPLAGDLGIDLDSPAVAAVEARDETGHPYVRYFTELSGAINVTGAPAIRMANPAVMFQQIIHDGLVGDAFLRNFTATYDLANSRVIFALPD